VAVGLPRLVLGVYLLWQVTAYPVGAQEEARCIDYTTHTPNDVLIGLLYVLATCGPALLSSRRRLRWFGLVSVIGVIATALVRVDELTSLRGTQVYVAEPIHLRTLWRSETAGWRRRRRRAQTNGQRSSPGTRRALIRD